VSPIEGETGRVWTGEVHWSGPPFRISGYAFIGGEIEVEFADDRLVRRITRYRDYEYPYDVRLDEKPKLLWVITADRAGTPFPVAHILSFDLVKRTTSDAIEIDPDDLPQRCPVK
jgi:hypothetical protein